MFTNRGELQDQYCRIQVKSSKMLRINWKLHPEERILCFKRAYLLGENTNGKMCPWGWLKYVHFIYMWHLSAV